MRPGLTRYAASAVSMVTPARVQPCSGKTRIRPFALCTTFGRAASAAQAAKARSSASSSADGSNQAAGPSAAASAISLTLPWPRAQLSTVDTPSGAPPRA